MRKNNKVGQWAGLCCLWLSLLITTPVFAAEETEHRFERMWPRLEQSWYFDSPRGIAVSPNGSVYVADLFGHRIQQFSAEGIFIRTWGNRGSGNGQFELPRGIAIAPDGSVYVTDTVNVTGTDTFRGRIQKFSAQGDFIQTWWSQGSPWGLAIAPDGSVYVADSENHSIQQFSGEGVFIRTWGSQGSGNGQFSSPKGLAVAPDGSVYVADEFNNRIQQFSGEGVFIRTWGSQGSGDGQLLSPKWIAIASDGSVYVTESLRHIKQFSAEGVFIRTLGNPSSDNKQRILEGIATASDGSVYVTDEINNSIQQFSAEGIIIRIWESQGSGNGEFSYPNEVAIAPDSSVYVADEFNNRIQQFSAEGVFIRTWGESGSGNGKFSRPKGLAIAPSGSVYVADNGNRIQQFSGEGVFIRTWGGGGSGNGQFSSPYGVAIAPDSSVYVADTGNNRIQQFSAEGVFIRTWGSQGSGNGQFDFPKGIAIAPDGSVYVTDTVKVTDTGIDSFKGRIQKFSAQGNFIQTRWSEGSGNEQFSFAEGIAISSDGGVYITDFFRGRIQIFSAQGDFIQTLGSSGTGDGQFTRPVGLAIAHNGSVYIADSGNHRIQKFTKKIKAVTPHPYKGIVLAGGGEIFRSGRTNSIWKGTWRIAKKAYRALTSQAFKAHEEIKFLTAGSTQFDLDQNNKFDDLETATKESLRLAITEWASDATDVVIYLSNHGGPGKFKINSTEILTSEELNTWVSQLERKISGKVTLVIEACNSASFFPQLTKPGRYLFASAKADQNAVIANDGLTSFSYTFWSEVATGAVVKTAFKDARQSMSRIVYGNVAQNSQAETDGNSIFNQQDLDQLGDYCLGECNQTAGAAPEIKPFSVANQTLNGEKILEFSVNVDALQPLSTVWAIVQRPDDISIDSNQPLTFEKINLTCDKQNQCQGRYENFDLQGEYRLNVYAKDTQGEVSFPETLTVTQTQGNAVYPVQYDENLTTVYLRDVAYQGQHYQVALEQKGGKFVLITASLAPKTFSPAAEFDPVTNLLTIPHALAFGQPHQARFRHLGNFEFELESATAK